MKIFSSAFTIYISNSGMHCITLDPNQVAAMLALGDKRFIAQYSETIEFHCALMVKKDGSAYINVGSEVLKKAKS